MTTYEHGAVARPSTGVEVCRADGKQRSGPLRWVKSLLVPIPALCASAVFALPEPTNRVGTDKFFHPSTECSGCHQVQHEQWKGSMMAYAATSPVFAALEKSENRRLTQTVAGDVNNVNVHGRLARTPGESSDKIEDQLPCQKCHSPAGVATDVFPDYSKYDEPLADNEMDSFQVLKALEADINAFNDNGARQRQSEHVEAALEGVTCTVCHRITGPDASRLEPGIANNAYLLEGNENIAGNVINFTNLGPILPFNYNNSSTNFPFEQFSQSEEHPVGFGVLRRDANGEILADASPSGSSSALYHGEDGILRPYIQTGEFCGSCHDVRLENPQGSAEPFRRLENLYTEWFNSPWNNNDNIPNANAAPDSTVFGGLSSHLWNPREYAGTIGIGNKPVKRITTCQDCHMTSYMRDPLAEPGQYDFGQRAINRPPGRMSDHSFVGVDRELVAFGGVEQSQKQLQYREVLLQKAVDMEITKVEIFSDQGEQHMNVNLTVMNVGAGHNVPAGFSQERQVWIDFKVEDARGEEVFRSGALVDHSPAHVDCDEQANEWRCDLGDIKEGTELNNNLEVINGTGYVEPGDDEHLVNYQNQFKLNGNRVLNPFISDETDNSFSLVPFEPRLENYSNIPLGDSKPPYTISAKLRFRPFPYEFLEALSHSSSRITEDVMKKNTIIEMEQAVCTTELTSTNTLPLCGSNAPQLVTGAEHACVLADGKVSCWGDGEIGKLGDGDLSSHIETTMVEVVDDASIEQLVAGDNHSCYLNSDEEIYCWGQGTSGRLGYGGIGNKSTPTKVVDFQFFDTVQSIAAGANHTCAIVGSLGNVECWGGNQYGQLGNGSTSTSLTPVSVSGAFGIAQLALGDGFTCALAFNGNVACWGRNDHGQLGNGSFSNSSTPSILSFDYPVKALSAGKQHACALLHNKKVMCWGNGEFGRLADQNTSAHDVPTPTMADNLSNAVQVSTGAEHTCALIADGSSVCWGRNASFIGTSAFPVNTFASSAKSIAAGNGFACAHLEDGGLQCWGEGSSGQLGHGSASDSAFPVEVEWSRTVVNYSAESSVVQFENIGSRPWQRDSNGTTSSNTGPSSGFNSQYYYYFETSGSAGSAGQYASLQTDVFDPSLATLSFNYHMYGAAIGELKVEVIADGEVVDTLLTESGNQGNQWLSSGEYNLDAFTVYGVIKIRITATATGSSPAWTGDVALDNIQVIRSN